MVNFSVLPSSREEPTSPPPPSPLSTPTSLLHATFPNFFSILVQYQDQSISHSEIPAHAFITLDPPLHDLTLASLSRRAIQALRDTPNPNNARPVPGTAVFDTLIVHWGVSQQQRQAQIQESGLTFPSRTVLVEENMEAVLGFMFARGCGGGGGYDFLEVRFREGRRKARKGEGGEGEGKKVTFGPEVKGEDGGQEKRKWRTKGKGVDRGFQAPGLLDYDL